jgi:hypothetical protein
MNTRFSTRTMLIILSLMCFLLGIHLTIVERIYLIDIALVWVIAMMTIYLCVRDAQQHGRGILRIFRLIMFFTWPWSILIYYIRFYGWRGLLRVMLWGLLFCFFYYAGGIGIVLLL